MILAAGILFQAKDGRVLLVRRSAEGDHAGEWGIPGGKVEDGETAAQAAVREAAEEVGADAQSPAHAAPLRLLARRQAEGVDWTTFLKPVDAPFEPRLNEEHTEAGWFHPCDAPSPMHPGAEIVLARLDMDELDIARAIRDGDLASPQRYENIALVAMRITGTGAAYREGHNEYVWRDPSLYLTDEFLARCNGLPVVVEHPPADVLTSDEFAARIVGTIMLPFVKQNEVWGIAKIYDASTIQMIEDHRLSTSPAVVFRKPGVNQTERLEDGETLLIEGKPSLLDHLALCEVGVWDKGGEPAGVASTANSGANPVPDEIDPNAPPKEAPAAKADAGAEGGDKLDAILGRLDSLGARLDAMEGGAPAEMGAEGAPVMPEKTAADAGPDMSGLPPEIASMPEDTAADKVRKDAACAGWNAGQKAKADAAAKEAEDAKGMKEGLVRMDSTTAALRQEVAELRAAMRQPPEDDARLMAEEQVRADSVYGQHGAAASRPMAGETLLAYRRRLAQGMQRHSAAWKDIDLSSLPGPALDVAVGTIYADAVKAARNPTDLQPGELREIVTQDSTGRRITSFAGEPRAWMEQFGSNRRRLVGINNGSR